MVSAISASEPTRREVVVDVRPIGVTRIVNYGKPRTADMRHHENGAS
jgi:hypothetical protein